MRLIKPYGNALVSGTDKHTRKLHTRERQDVGLDIAKFVQTQDAPVMAQWISAIDKIATKPSKDIGATDEQRELRTKLGNAAWDYLNKMNLLSTEDKARLKQVWDWKIAPYGETAYKERKGRKQPDAKGKWYARFAGDVTPENLDAAPVVEQIYRHLYQQQFNIDPKSTSSKPRAGLIQRRAESIANNTLLNSYRKDRTNRPDVHLFDQYAKGTDIARQVKAAIQAEINAKTRANQQNGRLPAKAPQPKHLRPYYRIAAQILNEHTKQHFDALTEAERKPFLTMHYAVKDCYRRMLKESKSSHVLLRLPEDKQALLDLMQNKQKNRDLGELVRLGKIMHYTRQEQADGDIADSHFWTSAGQAEIKRNEAFVRVWRSAISLASRTLKSWADPENMKSDDILNGLPAFSPEQNSRKLALLLGEHAAFFQPAGDAPINLAKDALSNIRNCAFHFKKLDRFIQEMEGLQTHAKDTALQQALESLWQTDMKAREVQLKKTLQAVFSDHFFDRQQNRKLLDIMASSASPESMPLPRFSRMLARGALFDKCGLPAVPSRLDREKLPAVQCRYTVLKLLYESATFQTLLNQTPTHILNRYIRNANNRATQAAKTINGKNAPAGLITARATILGELNEGEHISDFFFRLSSESASEMRVQRGYESDAEKAREQAEYIENLKSDVIAQTFAYFLKHHHLSFVSGLDERTEMPENATCKLDEISLAKPQEISGQPWQHVLYFTMHLVPVEAANNLLHQLLKWSSLAKKGGEKSDEAITLQAKLQEVLKLYCDMHDAKFSGGDAITMLTPVESWFEQASDFALIFPKQLQAGGTPSEQQHLPIRGLREMLRFGSDSALLPIFSKHKISPQDVQSYLQQQKTIRQPQQLRQDEHEKWSAAKQKKHFDATRYVHALKEVVHYKHLAARVSLTNHVRLYRLMMSVLGRLVDYAGLWERDLYFSVLAIMHEHGLTIESAFTEDKEENGKTIEGSQSLLRKGQIIAALRKVDSDCSDAIQMRNKIENMFGSIKRKAPSIESRNSFAHFNMLQKDKPQINLTECVNQARSLMAYDRKLKNAVSKSILELLECEGIALTWEIADHQLTSASLKTRQAVHLGAQSYKRKYPLKPKRIEENLHSDTFIQMAAELFSGKNEPCEDITSLTLDTVQWYASPQNNHHRNGQKNGGQNRSNFDRSAHRNRGKEHRKKQEFS